MIGERCTTHLGRPRVLRRERRPDRQLGRRRLDLPLQLGGQAGVVPVEGEGVLTERRELSRGFLQGRVGYKRNWMRTSISRIWL